MYAQLVQPVSTLQAHSTVIVVKAIFSIKHSVRIWMNVQKAAVAPMLHVQICLARSHVNVCLVLLVMVYSVWM